VRRWVRGQGTVEYALLLALIAIALIGIIVGLGPQIADMVTSISTSFDSGADFTPIPTTPLSSTLIR
jgi:Flp pilus assembly pilin Flp